MTAKPARAIWQGHLLQFESQPDWPIERRLVLRLLWLFIVFELVLGPRLGWWSLPVSWRLPLQWTAMLLALHWSAVSYRAIGFKPWSIWTRTERWYLPQAVVLANLIFFALFSAQFLALASAPAYVATLLLLILMQLLWGAWQELIYRGLLQTALRHWLRPWPALLIANTAFTFGPLHFYHLFIERSWLATLAMFTAIWFIGLLFGILFLRTRNFWLIAVLHGIGNVYIDGPAMLARWLTQS
ncbi:CPBP family intramembrane glutamic endopeptidase [Permianibacter aggregans]|uniref:CAAX prenyl protease-like protein n=1 Tax=Permianibacter aggregans TaxID=1510150 RepID=A0A4R6UJK9_9GAMM|nr:CPBP family intramembrane glutamic endopeptidase [Permianibacter aggregans]QGX39748.1 CPBP family intramembrane metalloprotease [Permianibacter aggregans]TDQ47130.1 CAAX prenyl protease-like protein [Permianibacter aggregans]